ncbi:nuclear transport factor 2 family protein [Roseobacteraceae bacterium S113]
MTQATDIARQCLEHILEETWVQKKPEALRDVYHPDAQITGLLPDTTLDLAEFTEMVSQFTLLVDVLEWEIVEDFSDGADQYFARLKLKLRLNTTQQLGWFEMVNVFQMRDGRPCRAYMLIDSLTFLEGVGALQQGALFIALAGGELNG